MDHIPEPNAYFSIMEGLARAVASVDIVEETETTITVRRPAGPNDLREVTYSKSDLAAELRP